MFQLTDLQNKQEMDSVVVESAFKSYGKENPILNGLNLSMKSGTIYALIGASGCGKTTLLSSIVGMKSLDKGDVYVLGEKLEPGRILGGGLRIGFMPQETALHEEFTVEETFYFFGNIYQMNDDLISERAEMLKKLLELPSDDQKVQECSGGEKRRISLAAAMIHDPEILILDEPTVGLDPILRVKIWDYLLEISQHKNISIILTTHYIDEASQANRCGLMRNGILIAQDSPNSIMQKSNSTNLEEAFLKICMSQESNQLKMAENEQKLHKNYFVSTRGSKRERKYFNPQTLKALTYKSFVQISRQPLSLFLIFVVALTVLLFHIAIADPINLKIGVVNEEVMNVKGCLHDNVQTCNFNQLSCRYINEVGGNYAHKKFYTNFDEASEDVRKGKLIAFIHISSNFSTSMESMIMENYYDDESLDGREIEVWLDRTDYVSSNFLQKKLLDSWKTFSESVSKDCNVPDPYSSSPVRFMKPIYGELETDFVKHMGPIFMVIPFVFLSMVATAPVFIDDRLSGFWNRTLMTGCGTLEIIVAHSIVQLGIITIQFTINIALLMFYHPHIFLINIMPSLVILFILSIAGCFGGMMIGCLLHDYTMSGLLSSSAGFIVIFTSGIFWPLESLPTSMRIVNEYVNIVRIPIVSITDNFHKGFSFSDSSVNDGIISSTFWCILFIFGTWLVLKLKRFS